MNKAALLLASLIIFSLFTGISFADDRSNARAMGMGNASLVSSFGIDAFGVNPANFDSHTQATLKDKKSKKTPGSAWEISLLSLGGSYGSDESMDFYNNYLKYLSINRSTFTNLFTDPASVLKFRDEVLPNQRTQVNYDFELKWFSLNFSSPKFGAINITMTDRVGLNTDAYSKDEEMPLTFHYVPNSNGSYDMTNVDLNQSEATAWWLRKYSLGYARQFDFGPKSGIRNFSFGFSAGLVQGFGNILTHESKLKINTYGVKKNSSTGINHVDSISGKQDFYTQSALTDFFRDYGDGATSHFDFFPKPAGTGFSFDLGISMQFGDAWKFAASVTDIGSISWDYNTFINKDNNSFIYRNFDLVNTDPTYNQFVNDLEGLNTRDSNIAYTTNMPTKYRAGLMFKPSEKFIIEFNCLKGDNNLPGNSTAFVYSLGTEILPLPYLPLRAGISVGGPGDYYIAFGAGLKTRYIVIDAALGGVNQLIASKRLTLSFSAKFLL